MKKVLVAMVALLMIAGIALSGDSTKTETPAAPEKKAEAVTDSCEKAKEPEFITTESGLRYADLVVGTGKEAAMGDSVACHYTLWIADENDKPGQLIQRSKDTGNHFECRLGDRLIKGWVEGMVGMKEGGTRMLIVPPKLGYGDRPPQRGKNIIFEIEYLKAM